VAVDGGAESVDCLGIGAIVALGAHTASHDLVDMRTEIDDWSTRLSPGCAQWSRRT